MKIRAAAIETAILCFLSATTALIYFPIPSNPARAAAEAAVTFVATKAIVLGFAIVLSLVSGVNTLCKFAQDRLGLSHTMYVILYTWACFIILFTFINTLLRLKHVKERGHHAAIGFIYMFLSAVSCFLCIGFVLSAFLMNREIFAITLLVSCALSTLALLFIKRRNPVGATHLRRLVLMSFVAAGVISFTARMFAFLSPASATAAPPSFKPEKEQKHFAKTFRLETSRSMTDSGFLHDHIVYPFGIRDTALVDDDMYYVAGLNRNVYVMCRREGTYSAEPVALKYLDKPEYFLNDTEGGVVFLTNKMRNIKGYPSVYALSRPPLRILRMLHDPQTGMVNGINMYRNGGMLLLLNEFDKRLFVYDLKSLKRIKAIKFSQSPFPKSYPAFIAVDEKKGMAYLSSSLLENRLFSINLQTGRITARNNFIGSGVALDSGRGLAYVARPLISRVDILDSDTLRTVGGMPIEPDPRTICLDAGRNRLYVSYLFSRKIDVFDTCEKKKTAELPITFFSKWMRCYPEENLLIVSTYKTVDIFRVPD